MKKTYLNISSALSLMAAIALPFYARAVTFDNPLGTKDFQDLITNLLDAVFSIVGLVAVIMVVYGGFLIMVSGGDEEKYKQGKKTITFAIIGLVVVILSYSILNFIVEALGG